MKYLLLAGMLCSLQAFAFEKESVGMIVNQKIKTIVIAGEKKQEVEGRISLYLVANPKQLDQGVIEIKDANFAYFGVDQQALSVDNIRGKRSGVFGFSANNGNKKQFLKYNSQTGAIAGEIMGQSSLPVLKRFAVRNAASQYHDEFIVPTVKSSIRFSLILEKPVDLMKVTDRTTLMGKMGTSLMMPENDNYRLRRFAANLVKPLDIRIIAFPMIRFEAARNLCLQPIRVVSSATDANPTGAGLNFGLPGARFEWAKADVTFTVRDWKTVTDPDLKVLTTAGNATSAEETELLNLVEDDDCIEVFFIENFSPVAAHGGGGTWAGGRAESQIISSDANNNGIDFTHLAHEIGHVLNLMHPGSAHATRPDGSTGTLMCPSGFNNDNPAVNSQDNKDNISNPLLTFSLKIKSSGTDCEDSAACGACP